MPLPFDQSSWPRSMPPPAPPPRKLDPQELAQLDRLRSELADIRRLREIGYTRRVARQRSKLETGARKRQLQEAYVDLYALLAGRTIKDVAKSLGRSYANTWRLLHGVFDPGEVRLESLADVSYALGISLVSFIRYLMRARRVWIATGGGNEGRKLDAGQAPAARAGSTDQAEGPGGPE